MHRFTKWQKVGLLLSIIWIVAAMYIQYSESIDAASMIAKLKFDTCVSDSGEIANNSSGNCSQLKQQEYDLFMQSAWTNASVVAFLPLPIFWLYGLIFLTIVRCFRTGSRVVLDLSLLSKPKRFFAYFCYLFSAVTVLFLVLIAMGKHVDSKVPTYLGYETRIFQYDDFVSAEGTWVNGNSLESQAPLFSPHQTSKIICRRNKATCVESKASIMFARGNASLSAQLVEYEVKSWTKNSIVYSEQNLCSETIFTIDLNSKTVTGVERFANNAPNKDFCQPKSSNKNTVYKLENGYTVYNNLRKEASPYFLKLVFALFGN